RGPARDRGLLPRLMGRAITEPDQVVSKAIRNIFEDVFERFSAAFARALPELSVEEIQLRLHFVVGALAFTVAGPYAFEDKAPSIRDHDVDHITRSLVSFVAAGLRASVNSKIKDKESR
ncbi:MAG: hypothetical protein JSW58_00490, partial [Candidatus Latescibacterota bacterium]